MLFHNPVILAKRFATLDQLSEGRSICGIGIGWSKDEYQASNVPFKDRGRRADEFAQALKKIWEDDIVEFHGQFYSLPSSKIGLKPVQKPSIQFILVAMFLMPLPALPDMLTDGRRPSQVLSIF